MKVDDATRNSNYYNEFTLYKYYAAYNSSKFFVYDYLIHYRELNDIRRLCRIGQRVLLLGLGYGRELEILLKSVDNSLIDVIDINQNFVSASSMIYDQQSVRYTIQDFNKSSVINADDGVYDLIVSMNTLEYVLDDEQHRILIEECARVLKKGGNFYFRLLNMEYPFSFMTLRDLGLRKQDSTVYKLRPYTGMVKLIQPKFSEIQLRPSDFSIPFGKVQYILYNNYIAFFSYKIGVFIAELFPIKWAKSIYFTLKK